MAQIGPYILNAEEAEAIERRIQDEFDLLNKAEEERNELIDQLAAKMEELKTQKAFLEKCNSIPMMNIIICTMIGVIFGAVSMYLRYLSNQH